MSKYKGNEGKKYCNTNRVQTDNTVKSNWSRIRITESFLHEAWWAWSQFKKAKKPQVLSLSITLVEFQRWIHTPKDTENVKVNGRTGYMAYLNNKKKLHSIILQYYQSPLMRIVLSVVQSCSGDVQHQSSHIRLLAIESIFIKDVCNCTLIIADKRQLKTKAISALRAGSFAVF